ncbi:MAG: endonuclease domain-containing protein [Alphaproteobacteria bacterium]|nr:endonuclease domain-containing protein [Alphaproteobacteria bacterium]
MRRFATPAERALWQGLRRRNLGTYFRRQFPIGPYRLVIEVDGETHAEPEADLRRDDWLAARGLKVLRLWNNEVLENLDGVLQVIAAELLSATSGYPLERPSPVPSRSGRGEAFAVSSPREDPAHDRGGQDPSV